ncbi:MAG: hypothetical protein P8012_16980 [Desulfobacterales bacterium]
MGKQRLILKIRTLLIPAIFKKWLYSKTFKINRVQLIYMLGLPEEVSMHGMNVRIQIQPGKIEEAAKLLREEVMPTAANYGGFVQNFLIVDAPNNRIASLSVWETETDAKAIYEDEGGLYQTAVAKLKPMLAAPPDAWMGPLTRVDK